MARRLAALGLSPVVCPQVRAELQGALPDLRCVATASEARDGDVVIAADTERAGDLVSCLIADPRGWRFVFTGHVAPGSPAAGLIAEGRAHGIVHDGGWCDVGYPGAIPVAERMLDA